MLFDDETAGKVLQEVGTEVSFLTCYFDRIVEGCSLSLGSRAIIDIAHELAHVPVEDRLKLRAVNVITGGLVLSFSGVAKACSSLSELVTLLLDGSALVRQHAVEDSLLNVSLGSKESSACHQKRFKALFGGNDVAISLGLSSTLHDFVVRERGVSDHTREGIEDGARALITIIEAAEAVQIAIEEIVNDILLSLRDLLTSPVELVHDLDEALVHSLSKVDAVLVQLLQLTTLSHLAKLAASRVEL